MRIDAPVFNTDCWLFSLFKNKKMKIGSTVIDFVGRLSSSLNKMRYGLTESCLKLSPQCPYLNAIKRGDCIRNV